MESLLQAACIRGAVVPTHAATITNGYFGSNRLQTSCGVAAAPPDGRRRALLVKKRSESNISSSTSAAVSLSTSKLLQESIRSERGIGAVRSRSQSTRNIKKDISCAAGTSAAQQGTAGAENLSVGGLSSQRQLGPATFALTEKVFRLWRAQSKNSRISSDKKKRSGEVSTNVATAPTAPATEEEEGESAMESPVVSDEAASKSSAAFDWKTNWYPVIPEMDIDKSVPYPFQILGRKVVFWHDGKQWSCVLDICPHRLAPLSEGRIDENGCIQCSYHGWTFRADGCCANIPQAKKEGVEARACEQSRARAVVLPVVVKQGILFVWPDENSPELAGQTEPPITPGIEGEEWCVVATSRDLPYGYDTGLENLADPSHLPFAHHNVNGGGMGKRSQATWLDLEVTKIGQSGFEASMKTPVGPPSYHSFHAPARLTYQFQVPKIEGARFVTTTYCTPTAPGNCRVIVVNVRNFMFGITSGPKWWQLIPRWVDHQKMLNLLDGDASLLHHQERYLHEKTKGEMQNWKAAYFMPTTADRYVGAFRQWLTRFAGNGVQYAEGVDPTLPPLIINREDLLNRYRTHTQQCQVCSRALRNFELARKVLFFAAALLLGVGAVLGTPIHRIQAVSVAAVAGLVGWWLNGWIQMFYYTGYDHARIP